MGTAFYCASFFLLFIVIASLLLLADGQKSEKEKLRERLAAFLKNKSKNKKDHTGELEQGKKQGFKGWVKLSDAQKKAQAARRNRLKTTTTAAPPTTTTTTTTTTTRRPTTTTTTTRPTTTTTTTRPTTTTTTTTTTRAPTTTRRPPPRRQPSNNRDALSALSGDAVNGWKHKGHNLAANCHKYPKNHSMC